MLAKAVKIPSTLCVKYTFESFLTLRVHLYTYIFLHIYIYRIFVPWASSASENNGSIGHKPFRFDRIKDALETAFDVN